MSTEREVRRRTFERGAADYDAVRPVWTTASVDWMLGSPAAAMVVVDLGAGTGLGTRTVAALGHRVTAVERSADVLAALERAVGAEPEVAARITTRQGSAEELAEADASVDAVVSFSAYHWFDRDRTEPECR